MASNAIHGRFGAFYVDQSTTPSSGPQYVVSAFGNLTSWSLNGTRDTVEVTTLGDDNKNYVSGLANGEGQVEGVLDTTSLGIYTIADGLARAFYRYNDDTSSDTRKPVSGGGKGYSYGLATFNGIEAKAGVSEAVTWSSTWSIVGNVSHV